MQWIHYFDDVFFIVFAADMSVYDEFDPVDASVNSMTATLSAFDAFVNLPWLKEKSVLLLLTRKREFATKLLTVPITICQSFDEYDGDGSYDDCCEYIKDMFMACKDLDPKSQWSRHAHIIDTDEMETNLHPVYETFAKQFIEDQLREAGLLDPLPQCEIM